MDERHLLAAVKYVELNPVRAGLSNKAEDYPWSSARAHLKNKDDALVVVSALSDIVGDWKAFLAEPESRADIAALRSHSQTGRPCGVDKFIDELEDRLGMCLRKRRRGPKKKSN
jgi:putative transposase